MPGSVQRVDDFQRRHPVVGFPLAVVYKFVDDQAGYLGAIVTYYAFVAIFPLMLIGSSVLGLLLQGNQQLQTEVLDSALRQFPIVGTQLGKPEGLQGSTSGVVIGALAALYGITGLGTAAQNAVNVAWAVPRNRRLNPVVARVRSLFFVVLAGLSLLGVAGLSSVASHLEVFGAEVNLGVRLVFTGLSVVLTAVVLSAMMRLATTQRRSFRSVLPGGFVVAVLWQVLQLVGGVYVELVIRRVSELNFVFALVLGLLALVYIAALMAMVGIEVNVVLGRRLWPRALLTPFTDGVHLTDADRRAYASYAKAQRHKGFETVEVSFDESGESDEPGQPGGGV